MKDKQSFYHASKKFLGNAFTFTPRIPETALISKEGNTPRVCVSTHAFLCIRSIISHDPISVSDLTEFCQSEVITPDQEALYSGEYFTQQRMCRQMFNPALYTTCEVPILPPNVSDFRHNDERWFTSPVTMKFVGYIDIQSLITDGRITMVQTNSSNLKYQDLINDYREIKCQ